MIQKNIITAKRMMQQAKKIAIFGHMSPDGDCIWAMLGLGRLLEKQKKQVKYFVPNTPGKIFNFVKNINRLKSRFDYKHYDLLLFVDFTWIDRIGHISALRPEYFAKLPAVIIDHHIDDGRKQDIIIRDIHSISTCEILFEQTHKRRPKLFDKEIATYFYLGIAADSGNFLFEEDHIRTLSNVVKLLKLWADKPLITNNLFRKKSLNSVKFLHLLLGRIQQKKQLLYTYYDEKDLEKYHIDTEEAAYALHIIQNIDGPQLTLLIRKTDNLIKWSLRAKHTDCNKIAKTLWWWGHKLSAGFSIPAQKNFEHQIEDVVQKILSV